MRCRRIGERRLAAPARRARWTIWEETYSDMGQGAKALDYFNQALPIWREAGEHGGEALTLNNMGQDLCRSGQEAEVAGGLQPGAVDLARGRQPPGRGSTLNNIGRLYRDLGQQQTALDYYNQALPIWREVGNRSGEALALNDIGRAYADMGQPQKALEYAEQALPIWRETGNRRGEAMTLNNMGTGLLRLWERQTRRWSSTSRR